MNLIIKNMESVVRADAWIVYAPFDQVKCHTEDFIKQGNSETDIPYIVLKSFKQVISACHSDTIDEAEQLLGTKIRHMLHSDLMLAANANDYALTNRCVFIHMKNSRDEHLMLVIDPLRYIKDIGSGAFMSARRFEVNGQTMVIDLLRDNKSVVPKSYMFVGCTENLETFGLPM